MAESYDFTIQRQETFAGFTVTYLESDAPVDLTNAEIFMFIKKNKCDTEPVVELSLNDGISIVDAENGIFQIDEREFDLIPKSYFYDIRIERENRVEFILSGLIEITQTITRF